MRKTYISPKAIQVCIEAESIIALSGGVSTTLYDEQVMTQKQSNESFWSNWTDED